MEDVEADSVQPEPVLLGDGELGQIRGILFGDQAAKTEQRIANLEADVRALVTALEGQMASSVSSLEAELAGQASDHQDLLRSLDSETKAREKLAESQRAALGKVDERLTAAIGTAEANVLETAAAQSRQDRRDLAELLRGVASQIDSAAADPT